MTDPVPTAELVHAEGCPGARIVRRETPRRHLLVCSGCSALVAVPKRTEWAERTEADT
ncbi:hypothetical protein [Ornithinimicrobium cryptoxanthini]|uniref:hypothetical protein n=1 Tax=Ornithinimicrobium cryptoxanthini TaxID=2934161 RepID=UPI0021176E30|nr:hypothetical protein [Ornithinimicrobium cryptoxanthini]